MGQAEYMGKAKYAYSVLVINPHVKLLLGNNEYTEEKSKLILQQDRMKEEIKAYKLCC
jgi:hypothetical protein